MKLPPSERALRIHLLIWFSHTGTDWLNEKERWIFGNDE